MSILGKFLIFAVTAAAGLVGLALFFEFDVAARNGGQTFTIMRGQNALQIASDLKAEGYIQSKIFFLAKVAAGDYWRELKAGEYDLRQDNIDSIIDKLVNARTVAKEAVIIPGWNLRDIASSLAKERLIASQEFYGAVSADNVAVLKGEYVFLESVPPGADLEGFLSPDTYQIDVQTDAYDFARIALDNFGIGLTSAMRTEIASQSKTVFEVVTMASILEKEVKTFEDKKIVAGLLWKRFDAGMPLQVDSTLLYYKVPGAEGGINKDVDSLYNTYRYAGLPAGPVCNPGIESIMAAIYPTESDYWYYLNSSDGTTFFSTNYGDHLINKAKYIDNL